MIGYVTLGTNDMPRAATFYDALLAELGAKRYLEWDNGIAWSNGQGAALTVVTPFDKKAATVGNGVMVALAVGSKAEVDRMHAKALSLGATDEGGPGQRGDSFYGGYFRDPDGNKLNFFFMG